MAAIKDLEITALTALAASPGGAMTLSELTAHLDARLGSTSEGSKGAQSMQSAKFREDVRHLISAGRGSGSIVDQGFATLDDTGRIVRITEAGHTFIGH